MSLYYIFEDLQGVECFLAKCRSKTEALNEASSYVTKNSNIFIRVCEQGNKSRYITDKGIFSEKTFIQ